MTTGDVYVADGYGKIADRTLIDDNLGNSIYAKSQRGVICYGSATGGGLQGTKNSKKRLNGFAVM